MKIDSLQQSAKGPAAAGFCPKNNQDLYNTSICFGDKLVACSNLQRGLVLLLLSQV